MSEKEHLSTGGSRHSGEPPPTPPVEPDAADCCGEGCTHCVFDVYDEALQRYRNALAIWRSMPP